MLGVEAKQANARGAQTRAAAPPALEKGTRVLKVRHTNNVGSVYYSDPNRSPRWYTPNPHEVIVPIEQVLHTGFEMEQAEAPARGASRQQRQAVAEGAMVLSAEDHEYIMDELRER